MRRVLGAAVAAALAVLTVTVPVAAAGADTTSADLSVSIAWVGTGHPRVHNGDTAMWTVTVTNNGPDAAQTTQLLFSGSDQWNQVTAPCGVGFCDLGTLAAGASVDVTISGRVCAFVTGESRDAFVRASVESATPDPNMSNNATGEFITKIIGPHGELCT